MKSQDNWENKIASLNFYEKNCLENFFYGKLGKIDNKRIGKAVKTIISNVNKIIGDDPTDDKLLLKKLNDELNDELNDDNSTSNLIFLMENLNYFLGNPFVQEKEHWYSNISNKISTIEKFLIQNINEHPVNSDRILTRYLNIKELNILKTLGLGTLKKFTIIPAFLNNQTYDFFRTNFYNSCLYACPEFFIKCWDTDKEILNKTILNERLYFLSTTILLNTINLMPSKDREEDNHSSFLKTIQFFIEKKPQLINTEHPCSSYSPLHLAIEKEQYEVARLLINNNANLIARAGWNNTGNTPYELALQLQQKENVPQDLLDKLKPPPNADFFNKLPKTPTPDDLLKNISNPNLYLCTTFFTKLHNDHPDSLQFTYNYTTLLHRAISVAPPLKDGMNAYNHYVALNTIKFLIKKAKIPINIQDDRLGYTALHTALDCELYDVANLLIENNADLNLSNRYEQQTPYQQACALKGKGYNIPDDLMQKLQPTPSLGC